jgi:hypothetical protein
VSLDIYYTYEGTDYLMPIGQGVENVNWRNIHGYPVDEFSVLGISDAGYRVPIPGVYRVAFDSDSVSVFHREMNECVTLYNRGTSAYQVCIQTVRDTYPVMAIISCPNINDTDNPLISSSQAVSNIPDNWNYNLIHGCGIRLTQSPYDFHRFEVAIGCVWVQEENRYVRMVPTGMSQKGATSQALRLKVMNNLGFSVSDIKVYIMNKVTIETTAYRGPIKIAYQRYATRPDPMTGTPVNVTLANLSGGIVDVLVDGYAIPCEECATGTKHNDSTGLSADGSTHYMFSEGTRYSGLCFVIDEGIDGTETCTLHTNAGGAVWEVKEESESTYTRGNDGLSIGTVGTGSYFNIDVRANVDRDISSDLNIVEGVLEVGNEFYTSYMGLTIHVQDVEPPAFFRTGILDPRMVSKMADFGVTLG